MAMIWHDVNVLYDLHLVTWGFGDRHGLRILFSSRMY